MPAVFTVASLLFWPLTAAACFIPIVTSLPRLVGQRMPWGLFAVVEWLYALDIAVYAMPLPPFWRGFTWLYAAVRVWSGCRYYRRWEDDDHQRPRRKRRVWRLAFGGGRV